MKKALIAVLVIAMTFSLIGCSLINNNGGTGMDNGSGSGTNNGSGTGTNSGSADGKIGVALEEDEYVFKVSGQYKLTDSAWLGVVPAGVVYTTEEQADLADVLYDYPRNFEERKEGEEYVFKFYTYSVGSLEDGDYIMVLCDNDDEAVGKVVLQFPIVIKGTELTPDFSKLKIG